jgi:hypothetical protein
MLACDKVHLRQEIEACRAPGGDPPAQKTDWGHARQYGKPPTFGTQDTAQFKRAIDMTDDELAAIASGATLHVVK